MKIVGVPTPVFEAGEKYKTALGEVLIIHDELEGLEEDFYKSTPAEIAKQVKFREGVIVKVLKTSNEICIGREDIEWA
jgi:hypothetical protein